MDDRNTNDGDREKAKDFDEVVQWKRATCHSFAIFKFAERGRRKISLTFGPRGDYDRVADPSATVVTTTHDSTDPDVDTRLNARWVDHIGLVVPDLDAATDFFVRVLGCELVFRTRELFDSFGGDWMRRHFDVDAAARLETVMLRCGPVTNIELLSWSGIAPAPGETSGIGAAHLAFFVDDLERACAALAAHPGVRVLGPPVTIAGEPNEGTQFVFVRLPWGLSIELVRSPELMPYQATTPARMYRPGGR